MTSLRQRGMTLRMRRGLYGNTDTQSRILIVKSHRQSNLAGAHFAIFAAIGFEAQAAEPDLRDRAGLSAGGQNSERSAGKVNTVNPANAEKLTAAGH